MVQPVPTTGVRVSAAEREQVGEQLGQAFSLGYLDVTEYDARLARVMAAVHGAELQRELADLPLAELARRDPRRRARRVAAARRGMAAHVGAYVAGMALMIAIWLVVGLSAGAWYPWPIWPALGWGVGVLGHVLPVWFALRSDED